MSRNTWESIKQSKNFYVSSYRRIGTIIFVSVVTNLILGIGVYFAYYNQPERDIYATNGITAPEQLTPMAMPNYSATPLLPADEEEPNEENKVIPQ